LKRNVVLKCTQYIKFKNFVDINNNEVELDGAKKTDIIIIKES